MYPAALHKYFIQTFDSLKVFKRSILPKQPTIEDNQQIGKNLNQKHS